MTVKDREHKRFIRRLPVWCESGGIKLKGFTVDLSSGGLAIWGKKGLDLRCKAKVNFYKMILVQYLGNGWG